MKTTKKLTSTIVLLFVVAMTMGSAVSAQSAKPEKIKTSAIEVMKVDPSDVKISPAFLAALYENLVTELSKNGKVSRIEREGDKDAPGIKDLVKLQCIVTAFKEGSERQRQVTTVAGASKLSVIARFTDNSGKVLLEKDVTGNVRFFGGNLKVTFDLAKHVAKLVNENF